MDFTLLFKALILGIVEGLTEFLPVSSTGHLILVGDLLDFNSDREKVFMIAIQLGAILAVCWEYRKKITDVVVGIGSDKSAQRFVLNLLIAFMPAAMSRPKAPRFIRCRGRCSSARPKGSASCSMSIRTRRS